MDKYSLVELVPEQEGALRRVWHLYVSLFLLPCREGP
jgi:hypothetical protein